MNEDEARKIMDSFEWPDVFSDYKQSELIGVTSVLWPEAQYLWMVRNPADTVASMVANGWYKPSDDDYPPGYLVIYQNGPDFDSASRTTLINTHGNRTRGDLTGDFTSDQWWKMSQVERCGWWWNYCNRRIAEQLKSTGRKVELVRLEHVDHMDWPILNASETKPVSGWEPFVEEMADALGY